MTEHYQVTFEPLYEDVTAPARATEGAAGYDVRAHVTGRRVELVRGSTPGFVEVSGDRLILEPGIRAAIPLGFRATLPRGLEAQLRLRSSSAFRRGLVMPNAPATVDSDYPGEWMILVTNTLSQPVEIAHLDRIGQIVFARVETVAWEPGTVSISSDRTGGIGSTGR